MQLALALALLGTPMVARAESLADAIGEVYRHNPALAAQRAGTRATDERISQARANYGPALSVSGGAGYERDRLLGGGVANRTSAGFTTNYAATVTQPVFTSGRYSAILRSAEANADVGAQTLRDSEIRVLRDTVAAYVAVRRDTRLLAIARDNAQLLDDQQSETNGRYKAGDVTAVDREQSENRLQIARAQVADAEGALSASRQRYAALVGHLPADTLDPEPPLPPLPATADEAFATGERLNPALLAAVATERRSRADAGSARAERGPTVALQGSGQRGPVLPYDNSYREFSVVGRVYVTVPLYSAGMTSSRIREALETNQEDALLVDQARRDMRQTIGESFAELDATRRSIPLYTNAADAADKALVGARAQRNAGDVLTIYVLDQARDLQQSRNAEASAEADAYVYGVDLLAAMGTLDVAVFTPDAGRYDPQVHRDRAEERGGTFYTPILRALDGLTDDERSKRPTPADGPR